jgi:hypothetical protein
VTVEQFGSIGEVIGALATVATLAYLAVQIRANTRLMRAQSRYASNTGISDVAMALAHDKQLAGVFRRGLANTDSLEPDELIQFTFLMSRFLSVVEQVFLDVDAGVSDPTELDRSWRSIRQLVGSPGGRFVWERQGRIGSYRPEFCSFVESHLQPQDESAPRPPARRPTSGCS